MIDPTFLQAANGGTSWPEAWVAIVAVAGGIILVTTIIVVFIWQIFATARARTSAAREEGYRKLAEEANALQARTVEQLEKANQELADLLRRTTELERLLREVE